MRYGNLANSVKESSQTHTILVELSRREQSNIIHYYQVQTWMTMGNWAAGDGVAFTVRPAMHEREIP